MAFIKTNRTEVYEDIQQNILMVWHSVHDEVDVCLDRHLLEGIAKRLSHIGASKEVFDRIGTGWIDYTFDIEYNEDGSFLPKNSLNIYRYPLNKTEAKAIKSCNESYKLLNHETVKIEVEKFEDFKPFVKYDLNGKYVNLFIKSKDKEITSKYPISEESINQFLNERKS